MLNSVRRLILYMNYRIMSTIGMILNVNVGSGMLDKLNAQGLSP